MSTPTPRTDTEITLTGAYTCTHHNDQMRAACPVCLITALTAERDQLRADCENETKWAAHYLADAQNARARAERAEAELASERARLDWLEFRGPWESWNVPCGEAEITLRGPIRAAIDAAMKEGAK